MTIGSAWELSEEAWDVVMDVNLKGVWNTTRAAIPGMIEAGSGGSIIITSSAAGIRGHVPYAHYVASKHGVVGLMKALSNELAPHAIRVNTVHPTGVSDTGITVGEPIEELAAREPLFALAAMNPSPRTSNRGTCRTPCCSWRRTRRGTSRACSSPSTRARRTSRSDGIPPAYHGS